MLCARYDLAVAFDGDAPIGKSQHSDECGNRGPVWDGASLTVDDDVDGRRGFGWGLRHRAQTTMGSVNDAARGSEGGCDDHDIHAPVANEIVKQSSQRIADRAGPRARKQEARRRSRRTYVSGHDARRED